MYAVVLVLVGAACSGHSPTKAAGQHPPPPPPLTGTTATTMSPAQAAQSAAAAKEVAITSCAADTHHNVEIAGTIRNPTTHPSGYAIQLAIHDPTGNRFYATVVSVSKVVPGAPARWSAATTAAYTAGMTCTVTSVSQHPY